MNPPEPPDEFLCPILMVLMEDPVIGQDGKTYERAAIERALKIDNTVILDFHVEQEENVFPMVPAGQAINKMIDGGLA